MSARTSSARTEPGTVVGGSVTATVVVVVVAVGPVVVVLVVELDVDGAAVAGVETGVDTTVASAVLEAAGVDVDPDEAVIDSLLSGALAHGRSDAGKRDERSAAVGGPALPTWSALEALPHAWPTRWGRR